jgi:hypothetical protein
MTDKYTMDPQQLESINNELFNSFDPEQELWIIGGSTRQTICGTYTYSGGQPDGSVDLDSTW